jgi:hypothetical protein
MASSKKNRSYKQNERTARRLPGYVTEVDMNRSRFHIVIDSYVNPSNGNWYRLWSDGWIEQGGHAGRIGTAKKTTTYTINLIKPMKDANYHVHISHSSANSNAFVHQVAAQATTKFNMLVYDVVTWYWWSVAGYAAPAAMTARAKYKYDKDRNLILDGVNSDYIFLVESYYNPDNGDWYRVYSDGWIEQGGITNYNSSGGATPGNATTTVNVKYHKKLKNTYNFVYNYRTAHAVAYLASISIPANTDTVTMGVYASWYGCHWAAYGYGMDKEIKPKKYVSSVYTQVSGKNWCRVYSDGWCEQGGYVGGVGTASKDSYVSFNLNMPMADNNYQVEITNCDRSANATCVYTTLNRGVTNVQFRIYDQLMHFYWRIRGKVDIDALPT